MNYSKNFGNTSKHFNTKHSILKLIFCKVEVVTLLLILASFFSYAQVTYVPDDNFEQALIDLGHDDVLDDYVTTANINAVTYLNVSNKNIGDLTGIEDFLGLQILDCQDNTISSLDLSASPDLFILRCFNNQLTSLNVTQNPALERLYCNSNLLTSLDVSQNSLLWTFECAFNQLTSLDITNNVALQYTICSYNQITSLDVTQNVNLIELSCNDNQLIGSIDVTQNTNLVALNVFDNQLTSLDVTQNTLLDDLDCSFNNIAAIDVTQNTALTLFSCRFNQISNLDVSENTALIELPCDSNQLTNLDVSQNTALTYLGCHFNQLVNLNVKNGNNSNFTEFRADNNPNLTCIDVDDEMYATTNWTDIDAQTSFSENCEELSIADLNSNESLLIFPNPASNYITISSLNPIQNVEVYDLLGKKVKQIKNSKQIAVNELRPGMYLLKIFSDNGQTTMKIVIK